MAVPSLLACISSSAAIVAQARATASIVDVLISAAPVLFGESTGQGASTRKPAASRLSDTR
ncbi:hypothetical protein, partial [Enterobacter intestinihominis]